MTEPEKKIEKESEIPELSPISEQSNETDMSDNDKETKPTLKRTLTPDEQRLRIRNRLRRHTFSTLPRKGSLLQKPPNYVSHLIVDEGRLKMER